MHRIIGNNTTQIHIDFEGEAVLAQAGDSVAAALLGSHHWNLRDTAVSGAARGPFCMMGVCFDCLVEIDGIANCQACMTPVREGMQVKRQRGAGDIGVRA